MKRERMAPERCAFCRGECTRLCDYPTTHFSPDFHPPRPVACKLPICDEHTARQEDGADYCPTHQELVHPGTVEQFTAKGNKIVRRKKEARP